MVDLTQYIVQQLQNILPHPESRETDQVLLNKFIPPASERFKKCARNIKSFAAMPEPDPWHIQKYPIFLYYLARSIHEAGIDDAHRIKDRLYCLNKALHGCSLFYRVALPSVFCVSYASGVVLGNCVYGDNLLAYQGVTVGGYQDKAPVLGKNVVLMPNAVISGETILGNNVVVSAGVRVINTQIPDNSVVFESATKQLVVRQNRSSEYIKTFFIEEA
jgi:serine O-acetyltransferase